MRNDRGLNFILTEAWWLRSQLDATSGLAPRPLMMASQKAADTDDRRADSIYGENSWHCLHFFDSI
jgi:hypothetical protein